MSAELELGVPTTARGQVRATGKLAHLCPFKDEVDDGQVTITWTCAGSTLELHRLRSYLDTFAPSVISHEELTELIQGQLSQVPGIKDVTVATEWPTAGFQVGVTGEVPRDGLGTEGP